MMLILRMSFPADDRNSMLWDILPSMRTDCGYDMMTLNLLHMQAQESATFN